LYKLKKGLLKQAKPTTRTTSLLSVLALCAVDGSSDAQDNTNSPVPSSQQAAGILPVPDYSGGWWSRNYLTGDWGGVRTDLANKGVQFGVLWDQYFQGVVDGGRDNVGKYGGTVDYTATIDLMRMGVLPGALVKFRAESRYGNSVNGAAGAILPVNTDAFFPLTSSLDKDVAFTITDLNYTQFLSQHLGVFFGKLDTLDGDPNEFSSGRGTGQFMNANLIFNPALALRLPYSTLGAGLVWMPLPPGPNGGLTVASSVMNTADASTTTGFEDFGKGVSWNTEADFQYRLGHLPGGMNIGGLFSFDQHFDELNSRIVIQPGTGLTIPNKNSTWAVYWSAWQYVFTPEPEEGPIDLLNRKADTQGIGLFSRVGFADKETNPVQWAVSGGVGGRGMIPSRDNDTFGLGYYYNSIQSTRLFSILGVENSAQGFEAYYNIAITPAVHTSLDLQVVNSLNHGVHTATILGLRAAVDF